MASEPRNMVNIDLLTKRRLEKTTGKMRTRGMKDVDIFMLTDLLCGIFEAGCDVLCDVLAERVDRVHEEPKVVNEVSNEAKKDTVTATPVNDPVVETPIEVIDNKTNQDDKVKRWISGESVPITSVSTPHLDAVEPMKMAKPEEEEEETANVRNDFDILGKRPELMKRCGGPCGRKLPLTMFHKSGNYKDGLTHLCRDCIAATNKKRIQKMGLTALPTIASMVKMGLPVGRPDVFTKENSWDLTRIYEELGGRGKSCRSTINSMMVTLTNDGLMGRVSNKKQHSHYYWIEPHTLEALTKADALGKVGLDGDTISKIREHLKQVEKSEVQAC